MTPTESTPTQRRWGRLAIILSAGPLAVYDQEHLAQIAIAAGALALVLPGLGDRLDARHGHRSPLFPYREGPR